MSRVLVVDDDADLRRLLSLRLRSGGYDVDLAANGIEALARVAESPPNVVITDLRMDGMDGMVLFETLRRQSPALPVIVLTAHGTIPDAVKAAQRGVMAYLTKPFDAQALLEAVEEALGVGGSAVPLDAPDWRASILTCSAAMEGVLDRARLVAGTDAGVLISGESGTGKELLARAIHKASARASGPFIPVNCAAVPDNLLESELFGHRRGAFTGAVERRVGLFEAASGGTLFLDEVGDMPLGFQAKLLRVLQEGEVRPVGANQAVAVDVRVICATHRDLQEEVDADRFRADLRYRLDVVSLELPPLASRPEDIPLLARHFLAQDARRNRRSVRAFAPEALAMLVGARWPGNVRQLQNVVSRCVALAAGPLVTADLAAEALRERQATLPTLEDVRTEAEREYLIQVLRLTQGNVSQSARLAGRNRTEFYKLLARHALEPTRFRSE